MNCFCITEAYSCHLDSGIPLVISWAMVKDLPPMRKFRDFSAIVFVFLLCLQWIYFKFAGVPLPSPWNAISPGLAIFGASYILSWGAELAQFEIPQSLAIAFLALVAVLPEYAVDMYFAWKSGTNPQYIHY